MCVFFSRWQVASVLAAQLHAELVDLAQFTRDVGAAATTDTAMAETVLAEVLRYDLRGVQGLCVPRLL